MRGTVCIKTSFSCDAAMLDLFSALMNKRLLGHDWNTHLGSQIKAYLFSLLFNLMIDFLISAYILLAKITENRAKLPVISLNYHH